MIRRSLMVVAMLAAGLTFTGAALQAEVVAKYNFNGRTASGTITLRSCSASFPYNGEEYVPNKASGECGPTLENPGAGGEQRGYYRSSFNNSGSEESKGRETLFLDCKHGYFLDSYRSKGEGVLPAKGSFTWEIVVRIDRFSGTDNCGILLDATKGEVMEVNWDGKAVATRLWMAWKDPGKAPAKGDPFLLDFSVPSDDNNKVVNISTELKIGEWYSIAAVYDDAEHNMMLYVNGELKASADAISAPDRGTGFGIAGFGPQAAPIKHAMYFQRGDIDGIAFSNEALTPDKFVFPVKK